MNQSHLILQTSLFPSHQFLVPCAKSHQPHICKPYFPFKLVPCALIAPTKHPFWKRYWKRPHTHTHTPHSHRERRKKKKIMADWGPVFVSVVLFILLTPGLLIQIPGRNKMVEFGSFQTSGVSIVVHSFIYFALICIFLLAIGIHMYMG